MGTYGANGRGVGLWEISRCLQARLGSLLLGAPSGGVLWNFSQAEPVLLKLESNYLEGHD